MKPTLANRFLAALLALPATSSHAGTLFFDGGTANIATAGDGAGAGLGGTWNTTLLNWDQGAGLDHVAWDNSAAPGTIASFGGPMANNNRTITANAVNAVDLVFTSGGAIGNATRWTLASAAGTAIQLGDSATKKASFDASAMLAGSTVGVNVTGTLAGDVSGGLTLIGSNVHGTTLAATPYADYFNVPNAARVNLISFSNLGVNSFTGPVTIKNAVEIQGLAGNRYKALGPATNDVTLENGTLLFYNSNGTFDQKIAVVGTTNALSLNNNVTNTAVLSNAITSGGGAVLWSVAGTPNGRLVYSGDLSGFAGTLKVRGSATGATVIDTDSFGGTFEVESGSTLQIGNGAPRGTLGANPVVNHGAIVFNRSGDATYASAISGTGTVTKQGSGAITLAGSNTHEGLTTVTAGLLNLSGSLAGSLAVTGGRLELSGSTAGDIAVTAGTISGTGSSTGKLTLGAGTAITLAGGAVTAGLSAGSVEFFFPTSLDFASAPVAATVYDVLTYGPGGVEFPGDFVSYVRGTLNHDTVAKKFTFTAAGSASLTWHVPTGTWDQKLTPNWNAGAETFHDWDSVAFNDPGAPATVTLAGTLRPATVAVTNSAGNDYTFSGAGSLSGQGPLAKSGSGALVLATGNSHAGGTFVNGGTLRLENPTAAGSGAITLGDSTLSLFRAGATSVYANPVIASAGTSGLLTVDGSGADAGTGTNSTYTLGGIQVDGTLTVTRPAGGKGATQYNGPLSGAGTLVIGDNNGGVDLIVDATSNSRGRVFFPDLTSTFNGHVHVLERGNFLNNSLSPAYQSLTVDAGGAITLLADTAERQTTVGRFNGAGIVARNTQSGQATLVVGGADQDDSFTGIIDATLFQASGAIGLVKNGSATQTLVGAGIRPGGTSTVNDGTLKLVDTTGWASNLVFGAADSPVLEFAGSESYTMSRTITGGSANASLVKSSGGTLTLGGANPFIGSIRVDAGTLAAANNQAFGANGTTLTVADGAALDTGGILTNRDYHAIISGSGVGGGGVIVNSTLNNPTAGFRSLTLTGDATVGGSGRWDVRPLVAGEALVDLAGRTLTKTGPNLVALVNGTITAGTIQVNEGRLALTRSRWASGTVHVAAGAFLQFENNTAGQFEYGMGITLADATLTTFGNDVATAGELGLAGATTVDVAATFTHTQAGAMSGSGSMTKTGAGAFALGAADHAYAGPITVSAGTLLVNGTKSGAGELIVQAAATLGGAGNISGNTAVEAGGFIAPGDPGQPTGTLTLASATLAGTYQCQVDGAAADRVNLTGTLAVNPGASVAFSTLAAPTEEEYVIATYAGLAGDPPAFTDLPAGYDIDDSTPGVIKLVRVDGYGSWADSWTEPPLSNKAADADPDFDGVSNLLEYILGGDPRISDSGILPRATIDGAFLVLSYRRGDASEVDTTQTGQWSVNLKDWFDLVPVLVAENGADPDDMEIRIPLANTENGRLFGRLKAEQ
jgi:autotransporter-associated beta strand protein